MADPGQIQQALGETRTAGLRVLFRSDKHAGPSDLRKAQRVASSLMNSLLKGGMIVARVAFRLAAIICLIGGVVFPLMPNGYFALLPFLVGITLWALSDFEWLLPPRRSPFKSDHGNVFKGSNTRPSVPFVQQITEHSYANSQR